MSVASCEFTSPPNLWLPEPAEGNYFVATYPPFSCWRPECVNEVHQLLSRDNGLDARKPLGLYVHVPFCVQRCHYCYYLSYAGRTHQEMDQYVECLLDELSLYRDSPIFAGRKPGFVYFGGGTPSLLSTKSIRGLLAGLQAIFPWTDAEEITFECAPRSVTLDKLHELCELGVNRISLGVQQLNDDVLRINGRVHKVADVERASAAIQAVGFDEVNVDLIVGLVGETDESFHESLERVIGMEPDSVTIYQLEVPHNTPLYRAIRAGELGEVLPSWDTKRSRLAKAFARLEGAGYTLRSAYAAARNDRHQRFVYQEEQYRGADLLGLGVSSFSYLAGTHFQNHASTEAYLTSVRAGRLPIDRAYVLNDRERVVREFVLQLKLGRVDAGPFRQKFGVDITERFAEPLKRFADRGWLTYNFNAVELTRTGLLQVDRMLSEFYLPEHRGSRYW